MRQWLYGTRCHDQRPPFNDGTEGVADVTVENLDNGQTLKFALLVPYMIEPYGFYEGHGTPYRVYPRQVIEVFDSLTPAAPN